MFVEAQVIRKVFETMNTSSIQYVLAKNIARELPERLSEGKDIDIIVNPRNQDQLKKVLGASYRMIEHPLSTKNGWRYLYGLTEYEFWTTKEHENAKYYMDISFEMSCKSLMPKMLVPLDIEIQRRVWKERRWDEEMQWWVLDSDTQMVYYLTRCIFDKRQFEQRYIDEIEKLKKQVNWVVVEQLARYVFFGYSERLIQLICDGNYNSICEDYLRYSRY